MHFVCFHRPPWCGAMFITQLACSPLSPLSMTWITLQTAPATAGQHKNQHRYSESVTVSFSFPFHKKPALCCSFYREKQLSSCLYWNCYDLGIRFRLTAAQEHGQRHWWQPGSSVGIVTARSEFRPRQTRQLPRAVDLKGRLLSCQSY